MKSHYFLVLVAICCALHSCSDNELLKDYGIYGEIVSSEDYFEMAGFGEDVELKIYSLRNFKIDENLPSFSGL